jgi:hypothetical protein
MFSKEARKKRRKIDCFSFVFFFLVNKKEKFMEIIIREKAMRKHFVM